MCSTFIRSRRDPIAFRKCTTLDSAEHTDFPLHSEVSEHSISPTGVLRYGKTLIQIEKMTSHYSSIPFKSESGLSQINGIGKFSSAGIVLEFESKLLGLIKRGVKEFRIPVEELLDIRFRKGFFKVGAKIEIRLRSYARMSELPTQDGKLSLAIKRDDFAAARDAVLRLQKELEDYRKSIPPARTSVSSLFENGGEADTKKLDENR